MIAMLALTVSNGVGFAGPYEDAQAAIDRGDYATSLQLMKPLAEQGYAWAQRFLGVMYFNGFGVPKDYHEAVRLFRLAAAQGETTAQNNLGWMYQYGLGVRQDYDEAVRLYRLAVAQGNVLAQVNLGVMYFDGFGIPKDYHEAVRLYRLAVAQGSSADAAVARTAARAAANLGLMYKNGLGVPHVLSYMWLTVFKTDSATALLQTIVSKMRPEQIALAQKMAKQCKHSNFKQCGEPQDGQFSTSETSVPMRIEGGTYVVPVLITTPLLWTLSLIAVQPDVTIPADVVSTLMRTKTLKETDFLGEQTYVLADGSKVPSQTFVIRSLRVGNVVLENVHGSVASVHGTLLLGQTFLSRFKSWSVDNTKHALLLSE
jgi:hypothetical protein